MTTWNNRYTRKRAKTVAELLQGHPPIDSIMVRTNDPHGGDTLFGYCRWDGENLISEDGDDYYLDEMVVKHTWLDYGPVKLIYWIHSDWWSPKEESNDP